MSAFQSSTFSGDLGLQQQVHFLVIRMTKSFFLWIGDDSKMFSSLSVAMPPLLGSPEAASSKLVGGQHGALSQTISQKLAKKTACQVFVSVSLSYCEKQTELDLLKRILEEMTVHPEYFFEPEAKAS